MVMIALLMTLQVCWSSWPEVLAFVECALSIRALSSTDFCFFSWVFFRDEKSLQELQVFFICSILHSIWKGSENWIWGSRQSSFLLFFYGYLEIRNIRLIQKRIYYQFEFYFQYYIKYYFILFRYYLCCFSKGLLSF